MLYGISFLLTLSLSLSPDYLESQAPDRAVIFTTRRRQCFISYGLSLNKVYDRALPDRCLSVCLFVCLSLEFITC